MNETVEFVDYDEVFLKISTIWLSDPEIKKLTMSPDIDNAEQLKWFNGLKKRNDYYIKGIICNNTPIGAVGIKHIEKEQGEYWGYIGDKEYIGHGIGKKMLSEMCKYAKSRSIKSLYLFVADYNKRAYGLYLSFGFVVTKIENHIIRMEKSITEESID